MTDRVAWSRYEGDDIEAFAALCLYRERPRAVRIRPSRGDGGIDIYVKLDDGRIDIYQVKKHTARLTPQQLYKIKDSYKTVKSYAEGRHWRIATWYLSMPLESSKENDEWLAELNKDDEFEAQWQGLTTFDNWAIDHPRVVDYYFGRGRDQLLETLERVAAISAITLPGVDPKVAAKEYAALEPATVLDRLAVLIETLNDADPHFQYIVAVGPLESPAPEPTGHYPTVVGSYHRAIGDQIVTVHVLARFAESLEERPITVKATMVVTSGSDEEREWKQFLEHGRLPRTPIPVRRVEADFPGGLGDTLDEAQVLFKPVSRGKPFDRTLTILNKKGETLAEITAEFTDVRHSLDGTGSSVSGVDRSGLLTIDLLTKIDGGSIEMTYHFSLADDTGKRPKDALPAHVFTNEFFAPNRLRVADPHVPRRSHEQEIPVERPGGPDAEGSGHYIRYIQALAAIQQFADIEIRIPDARILTAESAMEAVRVSRLLAGETVTGEWRQVTIASGIGRLEVDQSGFAPLEAHLPLQFTINGQTVDLGTARYAAAAVSIANQAVDTEGNVMVTFQPAPDDTTIQVTWDGPESFAAH